MKSLQQAVLVQANDVAPHRLCRDLEQLGKRLDGRKTLGLDDSQQGRLSLVEQLDHIDG